MLQIVLVLFAFCFFVFLLMYILFRIIFYVPTRNLDEPSELVLPSGKIYEPYWDAMRHWAEVCSNTPHEVFCITSFDGLNLYGKYYECIPGAPIELMFHGYRGTAERDLSGGMHRCFQLGHNALIVDQRCAGKSEGSVITFGICEHRDCLRWVDFMVSHFGSDVKIILTGISMGASTVLIASDKGLPSNVIGILADCGFHSAKDIICSVAGSMHLPVKLLYPFVKLSARIFGHFDLEEFTAEESLRNCSIPVLFFHGQDDDFVPSYMSRKNYDACASRKKLILIPGAGHGLSFPVDPQRYLREMRDFFQDNNV